MFYAFFFQSELIFSLSNDSEVSCSVVFLSALNLCIGLQYCLSGYVLNPGLRFYGSKMFYHIWGSFLEIEVTLFYTGVLSSGLSL